MTKKQQYQQEWYKKNKAKKNLQSKQNYQKNKERRLNQINSRRKATPIGRWYRLVGRSKTDSKPLDITKEQFLQWAQENLDCYYCGDKFIGSGSGVDRVDSRIGYRLDNIVTCCRSCNQAKSTMSIADFKKFITKVYRYFCE